MSFMYFSNSFSSTLFLQVITSTLFLTSLKPRQYSFSQDLLSFSIFMQASYRYFSSLYSTFHLLSSPLRAGNSLSYLLPEPGDISCYLLLYFLGERAMAFALNWACRLLMSCSYFCSVALDVCRKSASRWLYLSMDYCNIFSVFSQRVRYSSHLALALLSYSLLFCALQPCCSAKDSCYCSIALIRISYSAFTPAISSSKLLACLCSCFLTSYSFSLSRLAIFSFSYQMRKPWSLSEVGMFYGFQILWVILRVSLSAATSSANDCSDLKRAVSRKLTLSQSAWHFSVSSFFLARYLLLRLRSSVLSRLFSSSMYLAQSQFSVTRFSQTLRAVSPKIFSLETDWLSESSTSCASGSLLSECRFSMGLLRMPCFFSIILCTQFFRCSSSSFKLVLPSVFAAALSHSLGLLLGDLKASGLSLGAFQGLGLRGLISESLGSQQCWQVGYLQASFWVFFSEGKQRLKGWSRITILKILQWQEEPVCAL